jgi:hypothetical protein
MNIIAHIVWGFVSLLDRTLPAREVGPSHTQPLPIVHPDFDWTANLDVSRWDF